MLNGMVYRPKVTLVMIPLTDKLLFKLSNLLMVDSASLPIRVRTSPAKSQYIFLDGMSGLWCVNVCCGRKELADAAYKQIKVLPYHNSFFNTTNLPGVELAKAIAEVAPKGFHHVFFTGSGSEGDHTIFLMVRRYWDLQRQPHKKTIIARINAYRGSTVCGAFLGGMKYMHKQGYLPIQ